MLLQATQKNTRQTARKVRLVADAVRGKSIEDAIKHLAVMNRRASLVVLKVMRQALANAQHNHGLGLDQLTLKNILVDEGPTYKRFRAVSRGRAHTILKRSCHVTVQLESAESKKETPKAASKKEAASSKKAALAKKEATKKTKTKKVATKKSAAKKTTAKKATKSSTKATKAKKS